MARPTKDETESQRNNALVVYLPPDIRQWIEQRSKETGDSLSRIGKQAVIEYAKSQGFKEAQTETDSEVSMIARQLAELTTTIERIVRDAKCYVF